MRSPESLIAITGVGAVSALGVGIQSHLEKMESGTHELTLSNGQMLGIAKSVKTKSPERTRDMAAMAAREALEGSFGSLQINPKFRSALFFAGEHHDFNLQTFNQIQAGDDWRAWNRFENPADEITRLAKLTGPPRIFVSACAAGIHAIEQGCESLLRQELDFALVGGANGCVHEAGIKAYGAIGALGDSESVSFSKTRNGFVLGEGAAFLGLERLPDALNRKANIIAVIAGTGRSLDASGIYDPHPHFLGAKLATVNAIQAAQIRPEEISFVNAHATGTYRNDLTEVELFRDVLGRQPRAIPLQAAKPYFGHLLAASAAIETVVTAKSLQKQKLFSIPRLVDVDPTFADFYFPKSTEVRQLDYALKTAYGFGGFNGALVLANIDIVIK